MDTEFYFSKFSSGGNSVELMGKGEGYQVISNEAPVFSSESLPDSLSRYYREISNLNSAQESGKDMSLSLFADEVVKLNRIIIPKLAMLGKSQEVSYMKSLNSALEEAMDCFFQDTLEQKVKAIKLWKADPMTALASVPSVNGDESTNAGAGETVTPKKLELKEGKKIDYNTVELKAVNPHVTAPFPGEDEFKMPIEAPTKVKSTMQMKNHPEKQKPITGEEIEPVYIKRSRIEKDEAFELGRDLGVNFDKISLEEWMEGLKIEHEHTDAVGDDHNIIGKIAHEHLKENPKYYKLLEEYVEKSIRKDFDKMEEGDQAHESINLERTTTKTGDTQKPINGGDDKLEKEAFSMDAPKVKNGEMQEPIMHKSTSNPSETNGHGEESSKRESDYVGESSNQNGPPRKIKLNIKTGEEEQTEGGGDVRENGKKYFDKSMDDDYEFDVEPVKWSHIEE